MGQVVELIEEIFRIYRYLWPSLPLNTTIIQLMIQIEPNVPLKETLESLSQYSRFSLIQKIQPRFFPTSAEASRKVAMEIRDAIKAKNAKGQTFVLGLATGSTPLKVYKQLISMYQNGQLSFKNVVTFNLDEYYPISKENTESYNHYMKENLFQHIDIPPENTNVPDGEIPRNKVTEYCHQYQQKIKSYGGIDLQVLGIGRTGHIGFNEPPSPIKSTTRLVYLHRLTRKDAANSFGGMENVPKCAITMGIETISKAKRIIIMAWSQSKATIVKKAIEGEQTNQIPSTFLHDHPNAVFYLDKAAGQDLSRFTIPWTIRGDQEDPIIPKTKYWILKIIFWLSGKVQKPLLRLTFEDYQDYGLSHLVMDCAGGRVQDLNLFAYKQLLSKISGWPLGNRPPAYDPETSVHIMPKVSSKKEKVLIFSPHPDDDVISMGGTLRRLKQQGHQVCVAYMTTGSNAVHDYQTEKYVHFMKDFLKYNQKLWQMSKKSEIFKQCTEELLNILSGAEETLEKKRCEPANLDCQTIRNIKGLIRSSQAKIAVHGAGIPPSDVYCLELPFYTHHSKRQDPTQADIQIVRDLLKIVEPTAIYAAGDLTDPHGTHRKCLDVILSLYNEEQEKKKADSSYVSLFPPDQKIFFYRGAWEQWDLMVARVIVPMSPMEVQYKMAAILKHQSQKDMPMFPGDDKREFWLRSKQRNRNTAILLKQLGLPDYEAVECFVNYHDLINYDEL